MRLAAVEHPTDEQLTTLDRRRHQPPVERPGLATGQVAPDMAFRDRFFTPPTAKAILSWRILLGVAVGVGAGVDRAADRSPRSASALAVVRRRRSSLRHAEATPKRPRSTRSPSASRGASSCRRAQRSRRQLRETVAATPAGPLRDRLAGHRRQASTAACRRGLGDRPARRRDRRRRPPPRPDRVCARSSERCRPRPRPAADRRPRRRDHVGRGPARHGRPPEGAVGRRPPTGCA